jgi:3-hydroxybutyryl-CoA dehydrogenase
MGSQIGCEYALGGHDVVLQARNVEATRARVEAVFALLSAHGLRTHAEVAEAARRVSTVDRPTDAAGGAEIVVESLPEDLELKVSILQPVCAVAPGAIVATNTSSLSISTIGEAIGRPERTVGTHYLNPPLLMPPVEVVAGERTLPETVEFVRTVLVELGKLPIVVRRDVSGFVWNRLQFALVRECVWLVENGVATAEDVDTVMREGLARRWRRVGPLRSIALGGADTWNRSGRNIVPELSNSSQLPDLSGIAIMGGDLAAGAAARDAGLASDLRDDTKTGGRS